MKCIILSFLFILTGLLGYCQNKAIPQVYNLPFKQGDAKWKSYKSAKDRIKAL